MALAALCLFAACSEKEGVYNPKKKIANIYKSSVTIHSSLDGSRGRWYSDTVTVAKYLSEAWTWDGKKLAKITFYEQNASTEVEDVVNFSYDGNQMVRAESDGDYMTFSYNGTVGPRDAAHGFKAMDGSSSLTPSSKSVLMVSPSGFAIDIVKHIKEHD